jgi:hypothetical protein
LSETSHLSLACAQKSKIQAEAITKRKYRVLAFPVVGGFSSA